MNINDIYRFNPKTTYSQPNVRVELINEQSNDLKA